jgi:hypothetical protein
MNSYGMEHLPKMSHHTMHSPIRDVGFELTSTILVRNNELTKVTKLNTCNQMIEEVIRVL